MTLDLNLDDKQADEIYKMNLEQARERQAKMKTLREARQNGEFTKPTKEERLAMMNNRLDKQIAAKRKMQQVLNAEQFTKWERGRKHMQQRQRSLKQRKQRGKMRQRSMRRGMRRN